MATFGDQSLYYQLNDYDVLKEGQTLIFAVNTLFVLGLVINCKGYLRMSQEISRINIRKIRLNGLSQAVGCLGGIRKLSGLNLSRRTSFRKLSFP